MKKKFITMVVVAAAITNLYAQDATVKEIRDSASK